MSAAATSGTALASDFSVDGALVQQALEATRAAAIAAALWTGRGDARAADGAATNAMRLVLGRARALGTIVTGEGAKDEAPMLADGEHYGSGAGARYDIAVDPLECTDLCAHGLAGALSTMAIAARGALWSPGPAFYMEKLVLPPAACGVAHLSDPPELIVERVARALDRRVDELRAVVLAKPRHTALVARLRDCGVSVATPTAGDVAGSLAVLLPDRQADLLLGVGGTPEGVMTACAARALGGWIEGRPAPQREDERERVLAAGLSTDAVLELDDLVAGDAAFVATGVTGGDLLAAPATAGAYVTTESLVITAGVIRRIRQTTTTKE
jgi:fructose-1,6-bisphosphatase II